MTKQECFDELKAIGHDLLIEGGALMNAKRASARQLARGSALVTLGADVQILRAQLFKTIALKRYRRLSRAEAKRKRIRHTKRCGVAGWRRAG